MHPVAPTGQDFVGVALVADIPDQLIHRRVKDGMDRHRQFHHPQRRPQMPAGFRDDRNHFSPHFIGQSPQFAIAQRFQISGRGDVIKQRHEIGLSIKKVPGG